MYPTPRTFIPYSNPPSTLLTKFISLPARLKNRFVPSLASRTRLVAQQHPCNQHQREPIPRLRCGIDQGKTYKKPTTRIRATSIAVIAGFAVTAVLGRGGRFSQVREACGIADGEGEEEGC